MGNYNNLTLESVNGIQVIVCSEENVRQILEDHCVRLLNMIIGEMEFYLNMNTCKRVRIDLFTRQNRGEQKVQGLIDISYRKISTISLQIVNPLAKLDSMQRKIVFNYMYDECDKLCDRYNFDKLKRDEYFFEQIVRDCEDELNERRATQSRPVKKGSATFKKQYRKSNFDDFPLAPPPYTSPNSSYGALPQNPYEPQTYFRTPMAQPQQPTYSSVNRSGQFTFVRPAPKMDTTTQAQRPMTAPIQCITTGTRTNTTNSNATNSQWSAQSQNPFQRLIPSQMGATRQLKTLLESTNQSYNQQTTVSNQNYGIDNQSGRAVSDYQQVLFANNNNIANTTVGQQSNGFEVRQIQRQSTEEFNAASHDANISRKRSASSYLDESVGQKSPRNESYADSAHQINQSQPEITMRYGECITDGTKTPMCNIMLEMNGYLNFNNNQCEQNNANGGVQAMTFGTNEASELTTPSPQMQTNCYQSQNIDGIVNDALILSDSVEPIEYGDYDGMHDVYEIEEVTIEEVNAEQSDANVLQLNDDDASFPMPSMPDLSEESSMDESLPGTTDEPNNVNSASETIAEPSAVNTIPESSGDTSTPTPKDATTTDSVATMPESTEESLTAYGTPENAGGPSTSEPPTLDPAVEPSVETIEHTVVESDSNDEVVPEGERPANDNDDDCEMLLVETQTQIQPFVKKEEPVDDTDSDNGSGFIDTPSTRRKCNRFVDLTEEDDDSDIVILDSDEEEAVEQKFVSIFSASETGPLTIDFQIIGFVFACFLHRQNINV